MAIEDNQLGYYSSLPYPHQHTIRMLSGRRFSLDANKQYKMPKELFEVVKDDPNKLGEIASDFIRQHQTNQVPRLMTLYRYYIGDNDIHYWANDKSPKRADNRITSSFGHVITSIKTGYRFGNPIKFQYANKDDGNKTDEDNITNLIAELNSKNDESYHEKIMGKNLSIMGRAYELLYIRENSTDIALKPIDPVNCFVVYDNSIEQHSLFAVYYYNINFNQQDYWYTVIYTDKNVYRYKSTSSYDATLELDEKDTHEFGSVPITEYINNDERMGDWEFKLDTIDAIDKSKSEMANSQEDFSNAMLLITGDFDVPKHVMVDAKGNPILDENGKPIIEKSHPDVSTDKNMMWLKPPILSGGLNGTPTAIQPDARYLTKELNAQGWQIYVDGLDKEVHTDTNTPDTSDENFASNASGVAMTYKLWGNDQERSNQESLYTRGIMRRLRLIGNYWDKLNKIDSSDLMENITPIYTPNLPKNDSEIVNIASSLKNTGEFSSQTIRDMVQPITGVDADSEKERVKLESQEATNDEPLQKVFDRKPDDPNQDNEEINNDKEGATDVATSEDK